MMIAAAPLFLTRAFRDGFVRAGISGHRVFSLGLSIVANVMNLSAEALRSFDYIAMSCGWKRDLGSFCAPH